MVSSQNKYQACALGPSGTTYVMDFSSIGRGLPLEEHSCAVLTIEAILLVAFVLL